MTTKTKSKKISIGVYEYRGLFISSANLEKNNVWNIWNDKQLTDEYWTGFRTKKEAINHIEMMMS